MATLVTTYPLSNLTAGTTALTTVSFTPAAGEVIVAKVSLGAGTPTVTGGGLTWSLKVSNVAVDKAPVFIYTAVVGASPAAMTVSMTPSTSTIRGMTVKRWSSATVAASPAVSTPVVGASSAPSATLTTTAANSVVEWLCSDWNESAVTTSTYRSSAVENLKYQGTGSHSAWHAHQTATAAGAQTIGLTAPASQDWQMVGFEILDASAVSKPATDSGTGTESAGIAIPMSAADSGTGIETSSVGIPTPSSDGASSSESVSSTAIVAAPDARTGTDSLGTTAALTAPLQTATGTDTGKIIIPAGDASSASSAAVQLAGYPAKTDLATGSDGVTIEGLHGDLVISLYAIHPTTGATVPLPDFTKLTLSPQRNSAGSISLEYPITGLNFDLLRSVITSDRDLEVEIWNLGSPTGALRGYLQEAAGDDVSEDGSWTFAGGFLELRMAEAVVHPQPLIGVPSLGPEVTVVHGTISQAKWDQLLALGYTGRGGDSQEALYVPQLVLDAVNNGTTVPVLADPKRELKFSAVSPGELVGFIMAQARARGTLTDLEWDFTAAKDSGGTTWPNVLSTKFSPGAGYDQILDKLVDLGLAEWAVTWTGSQKKLQMWVPQGRGVDRTLGNRPVVLRKGRNLLEAPRKWSVRDSGTAMLAAGSEGVYETTSSADAQTRRGRRIELSASANNLAVSSAVQAFAQSQLAVSSIGLLEVTHGIGFLPGEPRPLIAFDVGDWVYSQTGTSMDRLRVVQWTLTVDAKQNPSGTVTLNDTVQDSMVRLQRRLNALTSGETVVGTSEASQPEDTGVPQAPTGVIVGSTAYLVDGVAHSSVSASWDTVILNTDGTAATDLQGYKVQYKYDAGGDWAGAADVGANSNTASFDASPGVQLNVRVAAYDRNGNQSAWSDEVNHTTEDDTTPPPVPSTPVVTNYLGVLKIAWDGLSSAGPEMKAAAPDFEWCEVHLSPASLFTPSPATLVGLMYAKGEWVVADLDYGVTYYARLVAVDTRSNASAPSGQGSAVPGKVVSDDVFAGAIGSAQLANLAVKTANIDNGAVNDLQVGNLSVGKLTAGTFSAAMTLSGSIRTATTGARSEMDGAGLRLYNTAGTLTVRLQTSDGSALVTGTYQSGLTGERINLLTDGSMRLYQASGTAYAFLGNNEGAGSGPRVTFRGALDGANKAGYLNVQPSGVGMFHGSPTATGPNDATMGANISLSNYFSAVRGGYINLEVEQRMPADANGHRVEFNVKNSSSTVISDSVLYYKLRSSGGPMWTSPPNDAAVVFNDGVVVITTGDGLNYQRLVAFNFDTGSSETLKEGIGEVTFPAGRTALDIIRAAPSKDWYYRAEGKRPPKPGVVVQRRKKRADGTDAVDERGEPVFEDVDADYTHPLKERKKHRGPIAEELAVLDPNLVGNFGLNGDLTVDLRDLIGVLWKAVGDLGDQVDQLRGRQPGRA